MGKAPGKSTTRHAKRDAQCRKPSKTGKVKHVWGSNGDLELLESQGAGGHTCGERGGKRGKQCAVLHTSGDQYLDSKDRGSERRSKEPGKASSHANEQKRGAGVAER